VAEYPLSTAKLSPTAFSAPDETVQDNDFSRLGAFGATFPKLLWTDQSPVGRNLARQLSFP
jgi:hypothetical protein